MRSRKAFLKLLARVDPEAQNGFGFEGVLMRPGAWVTRAELRPALTYPAIPVLLEYSMAPAHANGALRRADGLYVLWRLEGGEWRELGRAASASWEWALDLRPLAIRALQQEEAIQLDMGLIASEINAFLDAKLHVLAPPDRVRLLGILHDQFASRLSA